MHKDYVRLDAIEEKEIDMLSGYLEIAEMRRNARRESLRQQLRLNRLKLERLREESLYRQRVGAELSQIDRRGRVGKPSFLDTESRSSEEEEPQLVSIELRNQITKARRIRGLKAQWEASRKVALGDHFKRVKQHADKMRSDKKCWQRTVELERRQLMKQQVKQANELREFRTRNIEQLIHSRTDRARELVAVRKQIPAKGEPNLLGGRCEGDSSSLQQIGEVRLQRIQAQYKSRKAAKPTNLQSLWQANQLFTLN